MRVLFILAAVLLSLRFAWAEMGFDEKYERDYNIFNPANRYVPDNPLNPAQTYAPDNPFNPANQFDPGNPVNPANRYIPNNPLNPANQYNPDNPPEPRECLQSRHPLRTPEPAFTRQSVSAVARSLYKSIIVCRNNPMEKNRGYDA